MSGRVRFEARSPTKTGASRELELRPARFIDVELRGADGEILAATETDAEGLFQLAPVTGGVKLLVWAQVKNSDHDVAVTLDQVGSVVHRMEVPLSSAGQSPLEIVAGDSAEGGPAGAFHILDTMVFGLEAAERWSGRQMPPIFVYWGRGVTTSWSYYRGELPRGSGRYGFELLGGQPGQQTTSDTDEHDEAIMVHELGHLVMDLLSTDSSVGGRHPPGVLVDPGLAWEEGRVSWFATAALGDGLYQDTIGVEPTGRLRVDRDYSRVNPGPQGIGSEQTVGEVLWDLSDGAGGLEDEDGDGIALGPQAVLRAMMAMTEVPGVYPCLSTFLRFLVTSGRVSELELKGMLARTGQPASVFPTGDEDLWPEDLSIPAEVTGRIDGFSTPAPSGGPAHPSTGFDATRAYRIHLATASVVTIVLAIEGSGHEADRRDLDLELRDAHAQLVAQRRTERPVEALRQLALPAGWYVIYVRDGGAGNRASYRLSVQAAGP